MPDITMCTGVGCPETLREKCYRFKAKPTPHYQSFFVTPPIKSDGLCSYYWNNQPYASVKPVKTNNKSKRSNK